MIKNIDDIVSESENSELFEIYSIVLREKQLEVIYNPAHLAYLLGMDYYYLMYIYKTVDEFHYNRSKIPKKNGNTRLLNIPSISLKKIQKWLLSNIFEKIPISEYATGFCKNKSIIDNAIPHLNKQCIINLDIKDFFPNITYEDVFRIVYYLGYSYELTCIISKLCTYKKRLPQGSPASPCISNIRCIKLDNRISKLVQTFNASYTRYADDITISGEKNITKLLNTVRNIITDEGFTVNENKTRIRYSHQRQEVTGIIVNGTIPKLPKEFKSEVRKELYYCKKFGPYNHQSKIGDMHSFYKEHLYGKILFINMVEEKLGKQMMEDFNSIAWDY